MGPLVANPATGSAPSASNPGQVAANLMVLIGGVPAPVASTQLANTGDPQSDAGIEILSVVVPSNAGAGNNLVQLQLGGVASSGFLVSFNPAPVQISITPSNATLALGATTTFNASVLGSSDTSVVWSVDPQPNPQGGDPFYVGFFAGSSGAFRANTTMPPLWASSVRLIRLGHSPRRSFSLRRSTATLTRLRPQIPSSRPAARSL
jgi:hypothetical protein